MSGHEAGGQGRGRGWYYKQKYGGGGRGRGNKREWEDENDRQGWSNNGSHQNRQGPGAPGGSRPHPASPSMHGSGQGTRGSTSDLRQLLLQLNGKGYGAYKDIQGSWDHLGPPAYVLLVDHVQSDAYAPPSHLRVQIPPSVAGFPSNLYSNRIRRVALCDFLTRSFGRAVASAGADVREGSGGWAGAKGGDMGVDRPGQYILERSSVLVGEDGSVEARFTVGLPAQGRTLLGDWAAKILVGNLPRYVKAGLLHASQDQATLQRHINCAEDSDALRKQLQQRGLVAFVANGAVLPRSTGASEEPMSGPQVIPFQSPQSLQVEITLPHHGVVKGMGVRPGVTLIVGGGFHGKSTLLNALEVGVYDKVPGDGRELVSCLPSAVKIRAEDGRQVTGVDISPFISNLPFKRDTSAFTTSDASGSTSQAANIMEALEQGSQLLFIDEDTSATNALIRDARMQALISSEQEPITPLIARVRALKAQGVSCILVIGGCGDYFSVADCVVAMDSYTAADVTEQARAIAESMPVAIPSARGGDAVIAKARSIMQLPIAPGCKAAIRTRSTISFGDLELDLAGVEQLVDVSQTRAICEAIKLLSEGAQGGKFAELNVQQMLQQLESDMDRRGLDALCRGRRQGNLARPRSFELAAALNRLRGARFQQL